MRKTQWTIGYVVLLCALATVLAPELNAQSPLASSPELTCSPAPCIFPNVMVSQSGYFLSNHVIVANPNNPNQFVVAAQDERCLISSFVGIFSSEDAGASWAHECLPLQPGAAGTSSGPIAGYDLNNVAYAGGIDYGPNGQNSRIVLASSIDNGQHWSTPVTVLDEATNAQLQVDTNPSSPFRNSLYILSLNSPPHQQFIAISHSSDGGKTWSSQQIVQDPQLELSPGTIAVARDGTTYVTWTKCTYLSESGCTTQRMYLVKSTDGGNTWGAPSVIGRTVIGAIGSGGGPIYPGFAPVIAVDTSSGPHSGNVYVMYPYASRFLKLGVITSTDGGLTFSKIVPVSKSIIGDEFIHWISIGADGTVGVTWLDSRLDDNHYEPYYAISTDGGVTFTGDQPLSSSLYLPDQSMGTLRTHVWVGNALYTTWSTGFIGNQIVLGGVQF